MALICGCELRRVLVSSSFLRHCDETKILRYLKPSICLTRPDAGQSAFAPFRCVDIRRDKAATSSEAMASGPCYGETSSIPPRCNFRSRRSRSTMTSIQERPRPRAKRSWPRRLEAASSSAPPISRFPDWGMSPATHRVIPGCLDQRPRSPERETARLYCHLLAVFEAAAKLASPSPRPWRARLVNSPGAMPQRLLCGRGVLSSVRHASLIRLVTARGEQVLIQALSRSSSSGGRRQSPQRFIGMLT